MGPRGRRVAAARRLDGGGRRRPVFQGIEERLHTGIAGRFDTGASSTGIVVHQGGQSGRGMRLAAAANSFDGEAWDVVHAAKSS